MAGREWNGIVPSCFCYLVPDISSYCVMELESAFCFSPGPLGVVAAVARARFFQCILNVWVSVISG
jgi:hypothetical protein